MYFGLMGCERLIWKFAKSPAFRGSPLGKRQNYLQGLSVMLCGQEASIFVYFNS